MGKKSRKGQTTRPADHAHHKSGQGSHHHHHLYSGSHTNHHHHPRQYQHVESATRDGDDSTLPSLEDARQPLNDPLCLALDDSGVMGDDDDDDNDNDDTVTKSVEKRSDVVLQQELSSTEEAVVAGETWPTHSPPRSPPSRVAGVTDRNNTNVQTPHRQQGVRYTNHLSTGAAKRKKRAAQVSLRSVVQRVSRKAALSTKKAVWDSNDISMDAAVQAVHQWENLYNVLRRCSILALQQVQHVYQATKSGASSMEQGILRPVRDWIVLPAFGGLEQAVLFLQSEHAHNAARESLKIVRGVPVLGEHVLAPGLCLAGGMVKIPSKQQVRDTVDLALTSSKWALWAGARELFWYFKRADANITRTLSHTQWKVLGSGPYATLSQDAKQDVLAHITERYCSLHPLWRSNDDSRTTSTGNERVDHDCILARYELAAHIKRNNPHLYHDLIRSGLLLERGGPVIQDDEWLKQCPVYRFLENNNFLIPESYEDWLSEELDQDESLAGNVNENPCAIRPLWFRFPFVNGKVPTSRDAQWICFSQSDQHHLESRYREVLLREDATENTIDLDGNVDESMELDDTEEVSNTKHPTVAQWYTPDPFKDVLVDQMRHGVSFLYHCPECRETIEKSDNHFSLCEGCMSKTPNGSSQQWGRPPYLTPPPISGIMRPTFWRFHGPGSDLVRRSNWFLDTPRHGLQPFDDDAQTVLEDAYLFLKWMAIKKDPSSLDVKKVAKDEKSDNATFDGALLTVDVTCPDGASRLVQFGSLTQATAIQKGLSAAISINKLRVYRGAWLPKQNESEESEAFPIPIKPADVFVQEQIDEASAKCGTLGETAMPNTCLREILRPPPQASEQEEKQTLVPANNNTENDLAVPTERLFQEDMAKCLRDPKGGTCHHVCLIVHGIGEMMQSVDLFGLGLPNLSTIVDCCGFLRQNHSEVQLTDFSRMAGSDQGNSKTGRVEYLPVEWHEAFSILSQRRSLDAEKTLGDDNFRIKDISLPTIPNMREFANDTLLDVLFFMSPEHHNLICEIVSNEMNLVVRKFRQLTRFDGKISIIGHSLGSIISWDILSNQRTGGVDPGDFVDGEVGELSIVDSTNEESQCSLVSDYGTAASETPEESPERQVPPRSVSIKPPCASYPQADSPQLDFKVENFFLLGSPVAVFLMIRNQRKPLSDSFYLNGCRHVMNVFHPFDPIAYRIEPCIDPSNADFEPAIIKHWNGGFRLQYQTKKLWKRLLDTTWETQQNVAEAFEAGLSGMGLLDSVTDAVAEKDSNSVDTSDSMHDNYVSTGELNNGNRIDYMLQEKEIEGMNEYLAAIAAHSCYWTEKDFALFLANKLSSVGEAGDDE